MGSPPASSRWPRLRSLVVVALAAGLLVGMRQGWLAPPPRPGPTQWAMLYRRAGDTFVRAFYLTSADAHSARGRGLLQLAARYYRLSLRADAAAPDSAASLGLVLHVLNQDREARQVLSSAAMRPGPSSQKRAVAGALLMLGSPPDARQAQQAANWLSGLAPAPLVLAAIYDSAGRPDLADEEWKTAAAGAERILPRLLAMMLICGPLLLAGLVGLVLALVRLARPRVAAPEPSSPAPWTMREAGGALVVWVFVGAAAGSLLARLGPHSAATGPTSVVLMAPSLIAGAGAIAWIWATSRRAKRFGWAFGHCWRDVGLGLAAAGVAAPALWGVMKLTLWLAAQFARSELGPVEHPLAPLLAAASGWGSKGWLIAGVAAIAPALEETLFRGVLYRGLRRSWSWWPAAGASGLVFAVGHMSWLGLLPYLLLGVLLARLYESTGSLLGPWVAHAGFNAFNLAILMALFG